MIARQQVRIEPHVGAARVGIVTQANQLRSSNTRAEFRQRSNVATAKLKYKNNDQILLTAKLVAKLMRKCGRGRPARVVGRQRGFYPINPSQKRGEPPLSSFSNLQKRSRLPPQLDLPRIHDVQPRPMQPDIVPNLPRQ